MNLEFGKRPKEIYYDNAATTVVDPQVVEAMQPFTEEKYGNPETPYHLGQESKAAIELARSQIADLLGCSPAEIYFTSGGTEANNWAIKCVEYALNDGIVISAVEHASVIQPANWVGRERLIEVIRVDKLGKIDVSLLTEILSQNAIKLVSIQYANNEVGTIQPVKQISELCKEHESLFHCDMVQAFGKIPEKVSDFNPDLVSLSAHKIHGPMGIGALYVKSGTDLDPLLHGGGQEHGMRSGTHAVSQIVGFGKAAELCWSNMNKEMLRIRKMTASLFGELKVKVNAIRNGDPTSCLPNILNVTIPNVEAAVLSGILNRWGICVSTGAACHTQSGKNHVLAAMGKTELDCKSTLRISMSRFNTESEIVMFVAYLQKAIGELKSRAILSTTLP